MLNVVDLIKQILKIEYVMFAIAINVIEGEFHFVCICPEYSNARTKLYSQYGAKNNNFINISDADKFCYILENSNHDLAIYIRDSWKMRTAKLYR